MAILLNPVIRVFDSGIPANAAKIYTYQSGTTTDATTYTDAALSVANTNPIICDGNGEATLYVADSANLRLVIQNSSGTELDDIDPAYPAPILTGLTASITELNLLDGVTSSTAELNILDGVTATAAELNTLDGITSSTAELNILDGVTATAAQLNKTITLGVKGADIASAATTDLSVATGDYVNITGTTTITALGTASEGSEVAVNFAGALILTHNAASLILPSSANITTVAGDSAIFKSLGSGNWKCTVYQRQDGTALVAPASNPFADDTAIVKNAADATKLVRIDASGIATGTTRVITAADQDINLTPATQAEMETATATDRFVVPGRVQYNPGVAKAWVNFNGRGTIAINTSHNVTGLTDNGTGDYTITLTTAFSTANYVVVGNAKRISTDGGNDVNMAIDRGTAITTTAVRVKNYDVGAGSIDPEVVCIAFLGDQ